MMLKQSTDFTNVMYDIKKVAEKVYTHAVPIGNVTFKIPDTAGRVFSFMKVVRSQLYPMIEELSRKEVTARRLKKQYIVEDDLKKINDYIDNVIAELTLEALKS